MTVTVQHINVPAFFALNADWPRIAAAGAVVRFVVLENSFIGLQDGPLQDAKNQFDMMFGQGQRVLGYVDTQHAKRDFGDILDEVQSWYTKYTDQNGIHIHGLFLDNGPSFEPGQKPTSFPGSGGPISSEQLDGYYQTCYRDTFFARFQGLHPGQIVFLNAAGFPNPWVLDAADYIVTWENTIDAYINSYHPTGLNEMPAPIPDWWTNPDYADRLHHTVYNVCPPPSGPVCPDVPPILSSGNPSSSRDRNAGNVYIYDRPSAFYDRLPPYWQQEVDTVRANNRMQITALLDQERADRRDMDRPEYCADQCDGDINCIKECREGLARQRQALDAEIARLEAELRTWS